ncbi:Ubiquinone/menaquinone biosynthesis methyltransferase [Prochlorococcus marinus str. MIT 9515]|uniref:Ubiquinone/menaquinone biosynthesis methyltransferase n=1 Tax=Prochlorococcus marinus (strain MIT 9515) TaxID=167542 RepID=A2BV91_PROM5|nr:ubiquinone/menaquinone biosynthesis methyltransferase [Prochlorococcus marinus]ABM71702.1 Ubiquinone/menaquinone biosynthesis methyltransferase [Prochlorococcus marinus str. MIT 9515]
MRHKKINEVKTIFNNISCSYDFLNSLFSLGLHRFWKNKLVYLLKPIDGEDWADLCCGTGDLSFLIFKKVSPNGTVTGIDSAKEILNIARKRSKLIGNKYISWEMQDIFEIDENLKNYDGICMSYGLRNLMNVEEGLKKVFNLLNNSGRAGFLDFNHSKLNSLADLFQKIYLRSIVVPISKFFQLSKEYSYIEKSIKSFPEGNKLMLIAKKVGFKRVEYRTIFFNQMGILIVEK